MKGLRQKGGVCWHKKQEKITKLTKMWCVLAQITVNNFFYERTRTKLMTRPLIIHLQFSVMIYLKDDQIAYLVVACIPQSKHNCPAQQ